MYCQVAVVRYEGSQAPPTSPALTAIHAGMVHHQVMMPVKGQYYRLTLRGGPGVLLSGTGSAGICWLARKLKPPLLQ